MVTVEARSCCVTVEVIDLVICAADSIRMKVVVTNCVACTARGAEAVTVETTVRVLCRYTLRVKERVLVLTDVIVRNLVVAGTKLVIVWRLVTKTMLVETADTVVFEVASCVM
jgi:hypothetical protein